MEITSETKTIALIGHPTIHSRSPQMHNAALRKLGLPYVYLAYDIEPSNLKKAIAGMKALQFTGWNVTIPHKVAIIDELDELDESAKAIGAVNTVVNRNQKWVGYNTDGLGYLQSLQEEMKINLKGKKVVILGAGGAARAVGYTLAIAGVKKITIANRTMSKAERLSEHLAQWTETETVSLDSCKQAIESAALLVNTTSVGMHPHVEALPIHPNWLHKDCMVSDLIYIPRETALLHAAKQVGAKVHNGMGMLVHQAAIAFELWLNHKAPIALMKEVLDHSLYESKA